MPDPIKLTIDGQETEVPPGTTVLQACQQLGVEIAHFCFHERLAIAGNCRMCLVEQERAPKPIASCAMPVAPGMVIHTQSEKAKKARHGVMEMLLINHPLDCPICDQGGECDLQDQAMAYGFDRGRYLENKRAVADKDFGPLVATEMTRCIHCTRCIRFLTDVAGVSELGATGRGEDMEIGTYIEQALGSELSGNIIDLCPVGALTSKPYAFNARPWELRKTESVDVLDAVGSNIRIDARGAQILRVLPRLNEAVNEEWISDKTRFAVDGLVRRRLDRPDIRRGGKLVEADWREALDLVADRLKGTPGERVAAIAGDLCDAELMYALKTLLAGRGATSLDCRQDGAKLDAACRAGYLFNTTIAALDEADACLLIGSNPRWEAPIVNARLRKRYLLGGFKAAAIGPALDLTIPLEMLGEGGDTLAALGQGDHGWAAPFAGKKLVMIVGSGALARPDGAQVLGAARALAESLGLVRDDWNGFNVLHRAASRVAGLDLGFLPGKGGRDVAGILAGCRAGDIEVLYLLGADELDLGDTGSAFVIYQGHHGDRGAARADVVLPGAAYTEKDGTYINTEGRAQLGRRAVFPPGEAREDWAIIRALSGALGSPLPFNSLPELRGDLRAAHPFGELDEAPRAAWGLFGAVGPIAATPFSYPIADFYQTDPISRASPTMAECSELFVAGAAQDGPARMAEFWQGYLFPTIFTVAKILCVLVPLLLSIAYYTYFERKVLAASQLRKGPNVVGPFGLLQPIADAVKMLFKETVIPSGANRLVFIAAPMLTVTLALVAWAVIPFGEGLVISNLNVGILYLFAISSLGVYGIVMAGWASNSRYAFLGALRSAAQMVSYEVSIGFVLVTVLLCVGSLNLTDIVLAQRHVWFVIPLLPMAVVFFISALAETNRAPFDLAEDEATLVAGFNVEYSSMTWLLFFMGEYGNMILMSALTSILFLGGWLSPIPLEPFTWIPGPFWLLAKTLFVMFCFLWVRATFPRFRYDQLMRLGWKVFLPLSLFWLVLTAGVLTAMGWVPVHTV